MHSDGRKTLIKRLRRGRQARERFTNSHISKGIAFQIRAIRDRLGWSQERLAQEVGMTQNAISRLESPEYGKPTLTTLRRLASAFDVALVVRFVPFSEIIDWVTGTPRLSNGLAPESLAVPNFDEEEAAGCIDAIAPKIWQIAPGRLVYSGGPNTRIANFTVGPSEIARKPALSEVSSVSLVRTATSTGVRYE